MKMGGLLEASIVHVRLLLFWKLCIISRRLSLLLRLLAMNVLSISGLNFQVGLSQIYRIDYAQRTHREQRGRFLLSDDNPPCDDLSIYRFRRAKQSLFLA